jgi:DNA primase
VRRSSLLRDSFDADQIRLINRLTKNITVLLTVMQPVCVSIRGIDLILEEGMNVKVCTFPDGEDPTVCQKNIL